MQKLEYWLIENNKTKLTDRAVGTESDLWRYIERNPHLGFARTVEYEDEFEGCIDLWQENMKAAA